MPLVCFFFYQNSFSRLFWRYFKKSKQKYSFFCLQNYNTNFPIKEQFLCAKSPSLIWSNFLSKIAIEWNGMQSSASASASGLESHVDAPALSALIHPSSFPETNEDSQDDLTRLHCRTAIGCQILGWAGCSTTISAFLCLSQ